ncbi:hypothetical protein DMUE_2526 [Dictyocoela muelleri]|nr:hypothetical protein DMUE_2526 [Dictyocoela muelleri]
MINKNIFLETTLHNLTFHDSSSIFSITQKDGFIYTTGSDRVIRKWKISVNERKTEFKYSTALNSSITLQYVDSFEGHKNTINCIRFSDFKNDFKDFPTTKGGVNYGKNSKNDDSKNNDSNNDDPENNDPKNDDPENNNPENNNSENNNSENNNASINDFQENNCQRKLNNTVETGIDYYDLMASCGDSGEVLVWKNKEFVSINSNDDDAMCLCWNKNRLFVGFGSGRLNFYEIYDTESKNPNLQKDVNQLKSENDVPIQVTNEEEFIGQKNEPKKKKVKIFIKKPILLYKLISSKKIHSSCIEGMSYNPIYNILATQARDATLKIIKFDKKFNILSKFEKLFLDDTSKIILFRKCSFSKDGNFLFTACGVDNSVYVIAYPFTRVYGRIGQFDSPVSTIIAFEDKMIMLSKRSLYLYDKNDFHGLEYLSMTPITDACLYGNILFVSAVDGFIYSVDINSEL